FACFSFFQYAAPHLDLPSFPTRRSSDLRNARMRDVGDVLEHVAQARIGVFDLSVEILDFLLQLRRFGDLTGSVLLLLLARRNLLDRKSTRLNSSHVAISYAVFCLKKKT